MYKVTGVSYSILTMQTFNLLVYINGGVLDKRKTTDTERFMYMAVMGGI